MHAQVVSHRGRLAALSVSLLVGGGALIGTTGAATAASQALPPAHVVAADKAAPASAVVDPSLPADEARGLVSKGLVVLHMEGDRVAREERVPLDARIRDVKVAPDGTVFVVTEEQGGPSSILRLVKAK